MKRLSYLLISCLLLCSTVYADQRDTGPAWESCKVFDLGKLDIKIGHVSPTAPALDTSLTFDRLQESGTPGNACSQSERFYAHLIDAGSRLSRLTS